MLPWHGSKIKQGIPAAPNVPEPLVFSGFPDILFMPFVSIKRFTFQYTVRRQTSSDDILLGHRTTATGFQVRTTALRVP